jgi:hypothetical protein
MAQIVITASLALLVFLTVIVYGFWKHGFRFFRLCKETFKECFPGSALITVSGFARPGILIEIQGMAVDRRQIKPLTVLCARRAFRCQNF